MPIATVASELYGGFITPAAASGKVQIISFIGMPYAGQTLAGSTHFTSGVLPSDGYQILTVAVMMTQAGTLLVTRYIDLAGTIARGSPSSTSIVANTQLIVDAFTDNLPYTSFVIDVLNGSGSTATFTNFAIILNAT